jgi:hypothetical protein
MDGKSRINQTECLYEAIRWRLLGQRWHASFNDRQRWMLFDRNKLA